MRWCNSFAPDSGAFLHARECQYSDSIFTRNLVLLEHLYFNSVVAFVRVLESEFASKFIVRFSAHMSDLICGSSSPECVRVRAVEIWVALIQRLLQSADGEHTHVATPADVHVHSDIDFSSSLLPEVVKLFQKLQKTGEPELEVLSSSRSSATNFLVKLFNCLLSLDCEQADYLQTILEQLLPLLWIDAAISLQDHIQQLSISHLTKDEFDRFQKHVSFLLMLQSDCPVLRDRADQIKDDFFVTIATKSLQECLDSISILFRAEVQRRPTAFLALFRAATSGIDKQVTTVFFRLVAAVDKCDPLKALASTNEKAFIELKNFIIELLKTFETWKDHEGLEVLLAVFLKVLDCSDLVSLNLGNEETVKFLSSLLKYSPALVSSSILTIAANSGDDKREFLQIAFEDGGMTVDNVAISDISDHTFEEVLALSMTVRMPKENTLLLGEELIQTLVLKFNTSQDLPTGCRKKLKSLQHVLADGKDASGKIERSNSSQLKYSVREALRLVCPILTKAAASKLEIRSQGEAEAEADAALALNLLFCCLRVRESRTVACLNRMFPTISLRDTHLSDRDALGSPSTGINSAKERLVDLYMATSTSCSVTANRATQVVSQKDFSDMSKIVGTAKKKAQSSHCEVVLPHPSKSTKSRGKDKVKIVDDIFKIVSIPTGFEDQVPKTSLILVESTKRNIQLILRCQEAGFPLLIEGPTGVGKSAAVMEAARLLRRPLIRFNLSSSVTCGDILGSVSLSPASSLLSFQKGPFTVAFQNGLWLLLDELNLASDDVLQVIESALDTGMLRIDAPSESASSVVLKRHEHFRLFATQNPHTGSFKGTRTALSTAFVSRFQTVCFQPPNTDELEIIISKQLDFASLYLNSVDAGVCIKDWPRRMVTAHHQLVQNILPEMEGEKSQPYAEITIRDLMKWAKGLASAIQEILPNRQALDSLNDDLLNQRFLFEGRCVYETRFLSEVSRKKIEQGLSGTFDFEAAFVMDVPIASLEFRPSNASQSSEELLLGPHVVYNQFDVDRSSNHRTEMLQFHLKFTQHILNVSGVMFCPFLVPEWHATTCNEDSPAIIRAGFRLYARYLPKYFHSDLDEFLSKLFKRMCNASNATIQFEEVEPDAICPFVVTDYVKKIWMYIVHAVKHREPVLVVGPEGCGKSELILRLGCLLGKQLNTWCMTADTETSDLVGKVVPKKPAAWIDGVVTKSVTAGEWLLLDNVTEAESTVLERLNPLLERDPMWVLTEKGETKNLLEQFGDDHDFRFLATATVSSDSELLRISPAMANRLTVVSVTDYAFAEGDFMDILALLLYHDQPSAETNSKTNAILEALQQFFSRLRQEGSQYSKCPLVTLRTVARIMLGAHRIHQQFLRTCSMSQALVTACDMCILQQLQEEQLKVLTRPDGPWKELKVALACGESGLRLQSFDFLKDEMLGQKEFVLDREKTSKRCNYANMILFAFYTNLPVLLEGPAATGKTSMVEFIGKCLKIGDASILYKTINSESTSIQDYFGTFIPCGDGNFADLQGPLTAAVSQGAFFLADEFNFADPAVLNALFPLLEGRKHIRSPVSGEHISVKDGFLFFATQNSALYSDRKQLPQSLRNRFLQAQVGDFAEGELAFILKSRTFSIEEPFKSPNDAEMLEKVSKAIDKAVQCSRVLFGTKSMTGMTIRDLIKWVERYVSLGRSKMSNGRPVSWAAAGLTMLSPKLKPMPSIQESVSYILNAMKTTDLADVPDGLQEAFCQSLLDKHVLSDGIVSVQVEFLGDKRAVLEMTKTRNPEQYTRALAQVHMSFECYEPVLLIGPTTFKTKLAQDYFYGRGLDIFVVQLSADTQVGDLVGQIHPYRFYAAVGELIRIAEQLSERLQRSDLDSGKLSAIEEVYELLRNCRETWILKRGNNSARNDGNASTLIDPEERLKEKVAYVNKQREAITSELFSSRREEHIYTTEEWEEDNGDVDYRLLFIGERNGDDDMSSEDGYEVEYSDDETVAKETTVSVCETSPASDCIDSETNDYTKPLRTETEDPISISGDSVDDDCDDDLEGYYPLDYFGEERSPVRKARKFEFQKSDKFHSLLRLFSKITEGLVDETVSFLFRKYTSTLELLKKASSDIDRPVFLFRDGSVTRAVKGGKSILFEDINLPSQAVVEKLNSLFESNRTLYVTEDVSTFAVSSETSQQLGNNVIKMIDTVQILATAHVDNLSENINLSPALRSRFSEILLPQLCLDDIVMVCEDCCLNTQGLKKYATQVRISMLSVQTALLNSGLCRFSLKEAVTWINMMDGLDNSLRKAGSAASWMDLFLVAGLLVLLDSVATVKQEIVRAALLDSLKEFGKDLEESRELTGSEEVLHWIEKDSNLAGKDLSEVLEIRNGYIKVKHLPIAAAVSRTVEEELNDDFLQRRFQFTATKTCLDNVIRILASLASDSALLLEGPPGIGKTSIVEQTASLLGFEVERISFTKDTSADVLIGSYIPKADKNTGEMVYAWQDGRVLEAYMWGRFLLFDEINLASQEVLDEIKAIIDSTRSEYTVRGLDRKVKRHTEFRVFATMNPTSVGGGRAKLPQSIESMFVKVHLQEYSLEEEKLICIGQFEAKDLIGDDGLIKAEDLCNLVELHQEVRELVNRKEIGKRGGPYAFNVRDLLKLRDVLYGNIFSLRSHLELSENERQSRKVRQVFVNDGARIAALRTASDLVYSKRFVSLEDQRRVITVVDKLFPLPIGIADSIFHDVTIDLNLPNTVRVGFVYLTKGHEDSPFTPLLPTTILNQQLQILASAVVSERVVVLQGPTCSRKTSLVCELSRLCCRKLHIITLSEDTDTDRLIGHWTPRNVSKSPTLPIDKCRSIFLDCLNCLLYLGLPFATADDVRIALLHDVGVALQEFEKAGLENAQLLMRALMTLWNAFERLVPKDETKEDGVTSASVRGQLIRERTVLHEALQALKQSIVTSTAKDTGFEFVESTLVQALRKGDWVLLDNLSAAPSDVIERILSLAESPQKLHLFESPESEKLSTGNGISSEFRLFATVNPARHTQTQLSSAFLNRVISVQLPELDHDALAKFQRAPGASLDDTELYKVVVSKMKDVAACNALAKALIKIHCELRTKWYHGDLRTVGGVQLTFRTALRTSQHIAHMNRLGINAVKALVNAVGEHYVKCCQLEDQYDVLALLRRELDCERTEEDLLLPQRDEGQSSESQTKMITLLPMIRTTLANLVKFVLDCLCYYLNILKEDKRNKDVVSSAVRAVANVTENLLTNISTHELEGTLKVIRSRLDLINSAIWQEKGTTFEDLVNGLEQYVAAFREVSVSTLSYQLADVTKLWTSAATVETALFAMGREMETCIIKSSFENALDNLNVAREVVSTLTAVQRVIDQDEWLSVYSFELSTRRKGSETELANGLDNVRNAISACFQHLSVVDCAKKSLQLLKSAVDSLEANLRGHAAGSAAILTTLHRILEERIVVNCERDRLLEFLNDFKLLPTKNVALLKLLLYAIEMLFVSSSFVPRALREVSDVESICLVEKLQDLSLLECGVDICNRVENLVTSSLLRVLKKQSELSDAQSKVDEDLTLGDDDNLCSDKLAAERKEHDVHKFLTEFDEQKRLLSMCEDAQFIRMWYSQQIRQIHCYIFRALADAMVPPEIRNEKFRSLLDNVHLAPQELKLSLGPLWILVFSELWSNNSSFSHWKVCLVSSDFDLQTELRARFIQQTLVFVYDETDSNYPFAVVISNVAIDSVYVLFPERRSKTDSSNRLLDRVIKRIKRHYSDDSKSLKVRDITVRMETESSLVHQSDHLARFLPVIALQKVSLNCPSREIIFSLEEMGKLQQKLSWYYHRLSTYLQNTASDLAVRQHVLRVVGLLSKLDEGPTGKGSLETTVGTDAEKYCECLQSLVVNLTKNIKQRIERTLNTLIPRAARVHVQKCSQFLTKVRFAITAELTCTPLSEIESDHPPRQLRLLQMLEKFVKANTDIKEMEGWKLVCSVVRKMLVAVTMTVDNVFSTTGSQSKNWKLVEGASTDLQSCLVVEDYGDALSYICTNFQNIHYHFSNAMHAIGKFGEEVHIERSNKIFQSHLQQAKAVVDDFEKFLIAAGLEHSHKRSQTYEELTKAVTDCCVSNPEETSFASECGTVSRSKLVENRLEQFIETLTKAYQMVRDTVATSPARDSLLLSILLDIRKAESTLSEMRKEAEGSGIEKLSSLDSLSRQYKKEIQILFRSQKAESDDSSSVELNDCMSKHLDDIAQSPTSATLTSSPSDSTAALGELKEMCNKSAILCKAEDFVEVEKLNKKFNAMVLFSFMHSYWEKIYVLSKELHDKVTDEVEEDSGLLEKQILIANMISDVDRERQHMLITKRLLSVKSLKSSDTKEVVTLVLKSLLRRRLDACFSVVDEGLYGYSALKDVCLSVARHPFVQRTSKLVNAKQILDLCLNRRETLQSQKGVFDEDVVTRLRPYRFTMTDFHYGLMEGDIDVCKYFLDREMVLEEDFWGSRNCQLTKPLYLPTLIQETEFEIVGPVTVLLDVLPRDRQRIVGELREFHFESISLFINTLEQFFLNQDEEDPAFIHRSYRSLSELPEYNLVVATTGVCSCLWILECVVNELLVSKGIDVTSLISLQQGDDSVAQGKESLEDDSSFEKLHQPLEEAKSPLHATGDLSKKQQFGHLRKDTGSKDVRSFSERTQASLRNNIRNVLREISNYLISFKDRCCYFLESLCSLYDPAKNIELRGMVFDGKCLSSNRNLISTLLERALQYTHARRQDIEKVKGISQSHGLTHESLICNAAYIRQALSNFGDFCYKKLSRKVESTSFCSRFQSLIQLLSCCVQSLCASVEDVQRKHTGLLRYHSCTALKEDCSKSEKLGRSAKDVSDRLFLECSRQRVKSLVVNTEGHAALELVVEFRKEASTVRTNPALERQFLHCSSLMLKLVALVVLIVERREKGSSDVDQLRSSLRRHDPLIADKYSGKDLKVEFVKICNEIRSAERQLLSPLEILLLNFVGDPFVAASRDANTEEWLQSNCYASCLIGQSIGRNLEWFTKIPNVREKELQLIEKSFSTLANVMQQKFNIGDDSSSLEVKSLEYGCSLLETVHRLRVELADRNNVTDACDRLTSNVTLLVRQLRCSRLDSLLRRFSQCSRSIAIAEDDATFRIVHLLDSAYTNYQLMECSEDLEENHVDAMRQIVQFLFEGILATGRVLKRHMHEVPYFHGLAGYSFTLLEQFAKISNTFETMLRWPVPTVDIRYDSNPFAPKIVIGDTRIDDTVHEVSSFLLEYDRSLWSTLKCAAISWLDNATSDCSCAEAEKYVAVKNSLNDYTDKWRNVLADIVENVESERKQMASIDIWERCTQIPRKLKSVFGGRTDVKEVLQSYKQLKARIETALESACSELGKLLDAHPDKTDVILAEIAVQWLADVEKYNNKLLEEEGESARLFDIEAMSEFQTELRMIYLQVRTTPADTQFNLRLESKQESSTTYLSVHDPFVVPIEQISFLNCTVVFDREEYSSEIPQSVIHEIVNVSTPRQKKANFTVPINGVEVHVALVCTYKFDLQRKPSATVKHKNDCYELCYYLAKEWTMFAHKEIDVADWSKVPNIKLVRSKTDPLQKIEKEALDTWDLNKTAGGEAVESFVGLVTKASAARTTATLMTTNLASMPFSKIEECYGIISKMLSGTLEEDIKECGMHINTLTDAKVPHCPSYFPEGKIPNDLELWLHSLKKVCQVALNLVANDLRTARTVQLGLVVIATLSADPGENNQFQTSERICKDQFQTSERICKVFDTPKWLSELSRNRETARCSQSSCMLSEELREMASYTLKKRSLSSKVYERLTAYRSPERISGTLDNSIIRQSRRQPGLHLFHEGLRLKPSVDFFAINVSSVSETWNPTSFLTIFNHSEILDAQFQFHANTDVDAFCVTPMNGEIKPNSSSQVTVSFNESRLTAKRNDAIQAHNWFIVSIRSQSRSVCDYGSVEEEPAKVKVLVVGKLQPIDDFLQVYPLDIDFGALCAGRGCERHSKLAVVRNSSCHNVAVVAKLLILEDKDSESAQISCKIGTDGNSKMKTVKPDDELSWFMEPVSSARVTVDCIPNDKPGRIRAVVSFRFPSGKVIKTDIRGVIVNPQLALHVDGTRKVIESGKNDVFSIDEQKTKAIVYVENSGLVPCNLSDFEDVCSRSSSSTSLLKLPANRTLLLPRTSVAIEYPKTFLSIRFYCAKRTVYLRKSFRSSYRGVEARITHFPKRTAMISLAVDKTKKNEKENQFHLWSIKEINGHQLKLLTPIPVSFFVCMNGPQRCPVNVSSCSSHSSVKNSEIMLCTQKSNIIECLYYPGTTDNASLDITLSYETNSVSRKRNNVLCSSEIRFQSHPPQIELRFLLRHNETVSRHFLCEQFHNDGMIEVDINGTMLCSEKMRRDLKCTYNVDTEPVNCQTEWKGKTKQEWLAFSDNLTRTAQIGKIKIMKETIEDLAVCGCEIRLQCMESFRVWGGELVPHTTTLYLLNQCAAELKEREFLQSEAEQAVATGMLAKVLRLLETNESIQAVATAIVKAIIGQQHEKSNTETENATSAISRLLSAAEDENLTLMADTLLQSEFSLLEGTILKACQHGRLLSCKLTAISSLNTIRTNQRDSGDLIDAIIESLIMPRTESWPYQWRALHICLHSLICLIKSVESQFTSRKQLAVVGEFLCAILESCKQLPSYALETQHVVSALVTVTDITWCSDLKEMPLHAIPQAAAKLCAQQPETVNRLCMTLKPVIDPRNSNSCTLFETLRLAAQPLSVSTAQSLSVSTVCNYIKKSALKTLTFSSTADCVAPVLDSFKKALSSCTLECPSVDSLLNLLKDLLATSENDDVSNEVTKIMSNYFHLLSAKATVDEMFDVLSDLLYAATFDDETALPSKLLPALENACAESDHLGQVRGIADVISLYLRGMYGDDHSCCSAFHSIVEKLTSISTRVFDVASILKSVLEKFDIDSNAIRFPDLVASARTVTERTTRNSIQTAVPALCEVAEVLAESLTEDFPHQLSELKVCLERLLSLSEFGQIFRVAAGCSIAQVSYAAFCVSVPTTRRIEKRLENLTMCLNRITGFVDHERLEDVSSAYDTSGQEGEVQVATYSSRWSFSFDFFSLCRCIFLLLSKQEVESTDLKGIDRFVSSSNFPKLAANCFASSLRTLPECLVDVVLHVCDIQHKIELKQTATHVRQVVDCQLDLRRRLIQNLLSFDLHMFSDTETKKDDLETTLMLLSRSASPKLAANLRCVKGKEREVDCRLVKTAVSVVGWYDVSLSAYFRFVNEMDVENNSFGVRVVEKLQECLATRSNFLPAERAKRHHSNCREILLCLKELVSKTFGEVLTHLGHWRSQASILPGICPGNFLLCPRILGDINSSSTHFYKQLETGTP